MQVLIQQLKNSKFDNLAEKVEQISFKIENVFH